MKQATASNLPTNVAHGTISRVDGWHGTTARFATSGNDTRSIHIHALAAGGESVTVTP
jgi:hypothetical protein